MGLDESLQGLMQDAYDAGAFRTGALGISQAQSRTFASYPGATDARALVFDAASLTKVLATWPLAIDAIARGELALLETVGAALGQTDLPGSSLTLAHLLTHTSALMPGTRLDLYDDLGNLAGLILEEPLDGEPGVNVQYANRGFILLGRILETAGGGALDLLFVERVAKKAGLSQLSGFRPRMPPERLVPTVRAYDGKVVTGIPHDLNAELLGGVAGHAGCFSTIDDLVLFGEYVLGLTNQSDLHGALARLSLTPWYSEGPGWRGLAWQLREKESRNGFIAYHHGFTGASLYLDAARSLAVAVLTDSVNVQERHPSLEHMRAAVRELLTRG